MELINKRKNYEYDTDYSYKESLKIAKLITIFLQDKENLDKENLHELIKYFYDCKIDVKDYLEYVKEKTGFDKIITLPTDIVTQHMCSEGHGKDFSWWTENYQRMVQVATKDFVPEKEVYTITEIKELIANGQIYPLYPTGIETNKRKNEYQDDINYLVPYLSKELEPTEEYFNFIFNKIISGIGNENLLSEIRKFIVKLKLNSVEDCDRDMDYDYKYLKNYAELSEKLIILYNNFDSENPIQSNPLDIVLDYLKKLPNIDEQWYTEITFDQIIRVFNQFDYDEDKEICDKIQEIVIWLGEEELCYEMASNFDWIDKKIMAEIVIASGDPQANYDFASQIEGADIERHKQVILNNEHSDDYFIERVKSLSLK